MRSIDVNVYNDKDYLVLVSDILQNEEFKKLSNYVHHNSNRFQHSLNVSYHSYKISKKLNLDYRKIARASLLHDFFLIDNYSINKGNRFMTLFLHPRQALNNSLKYYYLSDMERNIIVSHMFPFGIDLPRYKESFLVDIVDDYVSMYEAFHAKQKEFSAAFSFLFIFLFNFIFRW